MRIYIVITPFFPDSISFRGSYIYDQVKAVIATGKYERVVVIKPNPFYLKGKDYVYEGIPVYRFKTYDIPSGILPGCCNILNRLSFFSLLQRLRISFFDIVIAHGHVTGSALYINELKRKNPRIKTILQHHGFDVLSLENGRFHKFLWHRNYVRHYGIKLCNAVDLHVCVSKKTLEYLSSYPEIKIKDSYILYNGVDTEKFYPISNLKDFNYFKIGCVANFWELKDQITLIKAVQVLVEKGYSNICVEFVGSGYTLLQCKEYVIKHNLTSYIKFSKEVFHSQLLKYYNSLDLFILPSYYEALGCVYIEAHACGVPFIGVKGQGIAELIPEEDQNKWLIFQNDYTELASKIENYMHFRYNQILTVSYDIKELVTDFIIRISK